MHQSAVSRLTRSRAPPGNAPPSADSASFVKPGNDFVGVLRGGTRSRWSQGQALRVEPGPVATVRVCPGRLFLPWKGSWSLARGETPGRVATGPLPLVPNPGRATECPSHPGVPSPFQGSPRKKEKPWWLPSCRFQGFHPWLTTDAPLGFSNRLSVETRRFLECRPAVGSSSDTEINQPTWGADRCPNT
jgi:hypothetical protein